MTRVLQQSFQILRDNLRAYLILNLMFYGILALSVVYVYQHPEMGRFWQYNAKVGLQKGLLAPIYQVYFVERNIPLAAILTFVINLVIGSAAMLSLPSFIIPFVGIPILMTRFAFWGIVAGPEKILQFVPCGTILLEGQGYVLASLAIYLQGSRFLRPKHYGFRSMTEAYKAGFKLTVRLYVLIAIILFIAAIFESTVGITTSEPVFPRPNTPLAQFEGTGVRMPFSGSTVFYDPDNLTEADAKVTGVLLEDIGYFSPLDTTSARTFRRGSLFEIELYLPNSYWESNQIRDRFSNVCRQLNDNFSNRQYQITALSIDDSGKLRKKTFF